MFFEEGYVALSEATAEVFRRLQSFADAGIIKDIDKGLRPHLATTIWDICEVSTKIGVTAANSSFIEASKDLIAWADPASMSNEHINLQVGSVGSSELPGEDGEKRSRADLEYQYGGFLSLPVCIPENSFRSSLTFMEEQVKQPLYDEQVIDTAKQILQRVKAGKLVTREIVRESIGSMLSRRKLKLAWGLASQHHEPLKAPNRWSGL